MKKSILLLSCLIYIAFGSKADIIHVNINGGGNYLSIQQAIINSGEGDTVLVHPGTYFEIVDFLGKNITVASLFLITGDTSYISNTIIDGNHENYRLVRFTNFETSLAKLSGFTIKNAYYDQSSTTIGEIGLAVYIDHSSPVIENNRIVNNEFGEWYNAASGIFMAYSNSIIQNNTMSLNRFAYNGGAIYLTHCYGSVIKQNIIESNELTSGWGVANGGGIFISYINH